MKAVINEKETPVQKSKFPWIGEYKGSYHHIVLFKSESEWVTLYTTNESQKTHGGLYHYPSFTPFTGTITLSND